MEMEFIDNVRGLTVSEFVNFIYVSCNIAYSVKVVICGEKISWRLS